jgi:hypothetical protein
MKFFTDFVIFVSYFLIIFGPSTRNISLSEISEQVCLLDSQKLVGAQPLTLDFGTLRLGKTLEIVDRIFLTSLRVQVPNAVMHIAGFFCLLCHLNIF